MRHTTTRVMGTGPMFSRALTLVLMIALLGCSGYRNYRSAQVAEEQGDWDEAVLRYLELVQQDPSDLRYRSALLRAKMQASHEHFDKAKQFREAGLLRQAMVELQKAVQLDPTNQYAQAELVKVRTELEAATLGGETATIQEMKERKSGELAQPPVLNPRSNEPIDLDFPEPVSIQKIYQALGRAFGINVLFDPKLRDQDVSITLREVNAQDALEILMRTAGHFYKVLDEHSIIVVADTPQNRRNYEDLIIQTFFLSNSDVKDVMAMLRSLVDARKIASNEELNAIILRDTADKVKVAERIIRANDKAKAEVVVDVELLLLNTNALRELGVSLSSYQIGWQIDTGTAGSAGGEGSTTQPGSLRFSDLDFLNENDWTVTVPSFLLDFMKESTDAQTLAKPQLRISEGERARLRIGDRVPIPVTTFSTSNTAGSNVVPVTSFQYQDVGILIEVEPRVHHNEEVSLQISVEVSNLAGDIGSQPIIGTRNIETTIRLQDGETNFLAGLLRTDETNSDVGVPGLSDIPVLGRLFSKKRVNNQRTDIVLTLTPHIIRRADITEEDLTPIWVGTEANISVRGGSPRVESDVEGPFDDDGAVSDAEERMRQRLQQLPRGLQGREAQQEEEEPPPSGIDLVPGSPPSSSFGLRERDRDQEPEQEEEPPRASLDPELLAPEVQPWLDLFAEPAREPTLSIVTATDADPGATSAADAEALAQESSSDVGAGSETPLEPVWGAAAEDPGTASVELRMVPQSARVAVGDELTLRLQVEAIEAVSHLPATLVWDPEVLEMVAFEEGDFLGQEADLMEDHSTPGRLVMGASRRGQVSGVAGQGALARVRFRAVADGLTRIEFSRFDALDEQLGRMASAATAATVEVGEGGSGSGRLPVRPTVPTERPEGPGDPGGDGQARPPVSPGNAASKRSVRALPEGPPRGFEQEGL